LTEWLALIPLLAIVSNASLHPPLASTSGGSGSSSPPPASSTTSTSTTEPLQGASSEVLEEVKKDVFGRKGDFITSPEISQVFGEVSTYFL